jgi:D-alanyl-D-alanine carboxypeptidase
MFQDPGPQRLLDAFLAGSGAPGGALTIRQNGVEYSYYSGVADTSTGAPVNSETLFEAGSQTKMMTGVITMRLVAEGLIDLDAPIARYVDAADLEGLANAQTSTVRQMVGMSSGTPSYTTVTVASGDLAFTDWLESHPTEILGADESLSLVRGLGANFAPEATYEYSNTNYVLLGKMIEQVTGQSLETAFRERVFLPAGMDGTTLQRFPVDPARVQGYAGAAGGTLEPTNGYLWNPGPEGGAISQPDDMARFLEALLADRTLLSSDLVDEMVGGGVTPPQAGPAGSFTYGLGIYTLDNLAYGMSVGHNGGTLGVNSVTLYAPDLDATVSLAVNLSSAAQDDLALSIINYMRTDLAWAHANGDTL